MDSLYKGESYIDSANHFLSMSEMYARELKIFEFIEVINATLNELIFIKKHENDDDYAFATIKMHDIMLVAIIQCAALDLLIQKKTPKDTYAERVIHLIDEHVDEIIKKIPKVKGLEKHEFTVDNVEKTRQKLKLMINKIAE